MNNLQIISKHNNDYLRGVHSYYLGITSFADITHKEFLKIYLGISNGSMIIPFTVENKKLFFDFYYWKKVLHRGLHRSWRCIHHTLYKIWRLFCPSTQPLIIDWRKEVGIKMKTYLVK